MMKRTSHNNSPLVCNIAAFTPEQRGRYQQVGQRLHSTIKEVKELSNGYGFRLPAEQTPFLMAAEFITLERLCCPFLNFQLELEAAAGSAWLKLTGPKGVKQFLRTELNLGDD